MEGRLAALGVDREKRELDGTRWRSGGDNEVDLAGGAMKGIVQLNQFNTIRTSGGSFAYAPAAAGLDWVVTPGDETLAEHDVIGPLARCLGDVIAAQLAGSGQAVGVRADGTEVVCLVEDRAAVERALRGTAPSTRRPWDEVLPNATVDESDGCTRVTVPPSDRPVGRVLRLMQTRDLDALG